MRQLLSVITLTLVGCADAPPPGALFACSGTLCPVRYQCREGYCFPLGGDGGCIVRNCEADLSCGEFSDGCGGTLQCGACVAPKTCSANVCGCAGATEQALCSDAGFGCGAHTQKDNCGVQRTLACGSCPAGQACSATFSCVPCVPETDSAFCKRNAASCGVLSALDNCGMLRTGSCGLCPGCAADAGACCLARGQPCSFASECCDGRGCFNGRCERDDGGF